MQPLNAGTQDATIAMLSSMVDQIPGEMMFPMGVSFLLLLHASCTRGVIHV